MTARISEAKQAIRTRMWDLLEREHVTEPGVHGHIPAFTGAAEAAARLADLPARHAARVIKHAPGPQVTTEPIPETEHDFSVDLIITPSGMIECAPARRPVGLCWEHLTADQ